MTGTAHMLPIAGNPLREEAAACEVSCRRLIRPATAAADDSDYARCLDRCPGATAIDGESCPDPPLPGVICEKTYKPNAGGIVGGTVAVASGVTAALLIAAIASLPVWVIVIVIVAH